jgi:hypothetical protein
VVLHGLFKNNNHLLLYDDFLPQIPKGGCPMNDSKMDWLAYAKTASAMDGRASASDGCYKICIPGEGMNAIIRKAKLGDAASIAS